MHKTVKTYNLRHRTVRLPLAKSKDSIKTHYTSIPCSGP